MSENEHNKTEEATPFKLKRAREKGQVARGMDLGYLSTMAAFATFAVIVGEHLITDLAGLMRRVFATAIERAADPMEAPAALAMVYMPAVKSLALLGATIVLTVAFFEIVQLRGPVFSTHPLKPDFNRLNPAKGLKRLFSLKMLKETLKNVIKMAAYTAAAYVVIRYAIETYGDTMTDAGRLAAALRGGGFRLLFFFVVLAIFFAAIDQVIARQEFRKQMRMSKSELNREHKDREGEPRMKQKRKQLHREFAKQSKAFGDLPGSDMLIVNPQHFAVALAYDAKTMSAPTVTAKGRNHFALALKRSAAIHNIPVFTQPALARALHRKTEAGQEIGGDEFKAVADLYLSLYQTKPRDETDENA